MESKKNNPSAGHGSSEEGYSRLADYIISGAKTAIQFTQHLRMDEILDRAEKMGIFSYDYDKAKCAMDISAAISESEVIDRLLDSSDFDFGHDVAGIARHIDRSTGKLQNCFLPRCSR